MQLNGVTIEDTFAEAFGMQATRIVITAISPRWARQAAETMTGFQGRTVHAIPLDALQEIAERSW